VDIPRAIASDACRSDSRTAGSSGKRYSSVTSSGRPAVLIFDQQFQFSDPDNFSGESEFASIG